MKWLLAFAALSLTGCAENEEPPPLAKGMELSIENKEWPPRLARQFPPGTLETELLTTLASQGFTINREDRTAKTDWAAGFCNNEVDVAWKTDGNGRITTVGGRYFPVCP